jgi:hypothetical protein
MCKTSVNALAPQYATQDAVELKQPTGFRVTFFLAYTVHRDVVCDRNMACRHADDNDAITPSS